MFAYVRVCVCVCEREKGKENDIRSGIEISKNKEELSSICKTLVTLKVQVISSDQVLEDLSRSSPPLTSRVYSPLFSYSKLK